MFGKLFGGGSQQAVPKVKRLVKFPENDDEWRKLRLTDSQAEHSLILSAYVNPRSPAFHDPMKEKIRQARIALKDPSPGESLALEDMGGGEFAVTPSRQDVMKPEIVEGMKAEGESLIMLLAQDNGGPDAEGVMVFHPVLGGIGLLPANDFSLYNALFLNLVLRTGRYGGCRARVFEEKGKPVVRLDLARYETCYNRCQDVLHELGAGAKYVEE